jgi:hypothetical protein
MDWAKEGVYDPLLRVIAKYPNRLWYGGHAYTWGALPLGAGNPTWRDVTPDDLSALTPQRWANKSQINPLATWHIFRTNWVTNMRAEQIGLPPTPTVITEFGWGKMSDIRVGDPSFYTRMEARYPSSAGKDGLDGAESLKNLYRAAYPNWTHAQAMTEQMKWAEYHYPSNVEALLIFAYGTFADYGQDYANNKEFHARLEEAFGKTNPPIIPPTPTPAPPPKPAGVPIISATDPRWQTASAHPSSASPLVRYINIRHRPNSQSARVTTIPRKGKRVMYIKFETYADADGYLWRPVRVIAGAHWVQGWVRSDVIRITQDAPPF